jgi:Flp pilus assembly protein protease CpaA
MCFATRSGTDLIKISDPFIVTAVAGSGASSAVVDLYTRRIPNPLTLCIVATGIAIATTGLGSLSISQALLGLVAGLLLMLPGHLVGATGAGDVKLFAALGTLLGPKGILAAFLYSALAGGVMAIAVAVRRRLLGATLARLGRFVWTCGANVGEIERVTTNRFAYAPAIAAGSVVAALGL